MRATHIGECQVCGSRQMLPSGRLSLHGYTVNWGFFSGVCAGAKHLPLEQDKSLIEGAIASALWRRAELTEQIAKLRSEESTSAWLYLYRGYQDANRYQKAGYEWHWVEMTRKAEMVDLGKGDTYERLTFEFDNPITKKRDNLNRCSGYDLHRKSLTEACKGLNERYAKHLEGMLPQIDRYVAWQRERIAGWAPKELKPRPTVAR